MHTYPDKNAGATFADRFGGDKAAADRLFNDLTAQLWPIASRHLRSKRGLISLHTGDLVNEALARVLKAPADSFSDQTHLLATAAKALRHVLVDYLKHKKRQKRDAIHATLDPEFSDHRIELITLHTALLRLSAIDPDLAELAELRFFLGLSIARIAAFQNKSEATVKREWKTAQLWLKEAMKNDRLADRD